MSVSKRPAESTCNETAPRRCAIASPLLSRVGGAAAGATQRVTLLEYGYEALALRVHLIRAARESIDIQTYIWAEDEVGSLIMNELLAAARRGVKVRIIADQLESGNNIRWLSLLALGHQNLDARLYNPLGQEAIADFSDRVKGFFTTFDLINHRMHNKLMVFDQKVAITGGRNIQNKYYDFDPTFEFVDRDVLVTGQVVDHMQAAFEQYWDDPIVVELDRLLDVRAELERINYTLPESPLVFPMANWFGGLIEQAIDPSWIEMNFIKPAFTVSQMRYTADRPQKPFIENEPYDSGITGHLREAIAGISTRLTAQTPYLILSDDAVARLETIRKQRPQVEYSVVTNSLASTDHYFVYALSYKRKKRNIDALGFRLFEFKPYPSDASSFIPRYSDLSSKSVVKTELTPIERSGDESVPGFAPVPVGGSGPRLCIHAKSLVIDGRIGVVGSHNFDPRSGALNTESALVVYDEPFAAALEANILKASAPQNAWVAARRETVPLIGHVGRFLAVISRALPVFDLWPFRYISNFDLRAGRQAVPAEHPDFYRNYEDVGQFPGTGLGDNQIKTYLISGFGAAAEPLM